MVQPRRSTLLPMSDTNMTFPKGGTGVPPTAVPTPGA